MHENRTKLRERCLEMPTETTQDYILIRIFFSIFEPFFEIIFVLKKNIKSSLQKLIESDGRL